MCHFTRHSPKNGIGMRSGLWNKYSGIHSISFALAIFHMHIAQSQRTISTHISELFIALLSSPILFRNRIVYRVRTPLFVRVVKHYSCGALLIYLIGRNRSEKLKTAQLTASNLSRTHYCLFYRIPFSWMRILKTVQRSACLPLIAWNLEGSAHNGDGWCVHWQIFQKSNDGVRVLGEVFKLYYANKLVVFCVIFLLIRLNFTRIVCMDHKFSTVFLPCIRFLWPLPLLSLLPFFGGM